MKSKQTDRFVRSKYLEGLSVRMSYYCNPSHAETVKSRGSRGIITSAPSRAVSPGQRRVKLKFVPRFATDNAFRGQGDFALKLLNAGI